MAARRVSVPRTCAEKNVQPKPDPAGPIKKAITGIAFAPPHPRLRRDAQAQREAEEKEVRLPSVSAIPRVYRSPGGCGAGPHTEDRLGGGVDRRRSWRPGHNRPAGGATIRIALTFGPLDSTSCGVDEECAGVAGEKCDSTECRNQRSRGSRYPELRSALHPWQRSSFYRPTSRPSANPTTKATRTNWVECCRR